MATMNRPGRRWNHKETRQRRRRQISQAFDGNDGTDHHAVKNGNGARWNSARWTARKFAQLEQASYKARMEFLHSVDGPPFLNKAASLNLPLQNILYPEPR